MEKKSERGIFWCVRIWISKNVAVAATDQKQHKRSPRASPLSQVTIFYINKYGGFISSHTESDLKSEREREIWEKMEKAELGGGNRKVASAMEAYEKLEKVGEGTYGKVYRARERATGKIVALKKTRLHEDDEGVPPTTLREVSILRMLSCDPHVVRSTHYSPLISSLLCLVLVLLHLCFFNFSTLFKSHFSVWSVLDWAKKSFPISLNPTSLFGCILVGLHNWFLWWVSIFSFL